MAKKKLSNQLFDAIRGANELWRTFKHGGSSTREFQLGFRAGVEAMANRITDLRGAVEQFESTDTVRMAEESEIFDALQWNLAQYRQLVSILECERESAWVESNIVTALERVLRGEKMKKVTV